MRAPFSASLLVVLIGAAAPAADFLGPETCKACHSEAYFVWRQSKHAHALDALSPLEQKDAKCLTCHSPNLQDQGMAQVSCETCHGGGQYYAPIYVMKDAELARLVGLLDPSEKSCRSCHDAASPSLNPFDFVEKLKLIAHPSSGSDKGRKPPSNAVPNKS
jgi:hypothetical protein